MIIISKARLKFIEKKMEQARLEGIEIGRKQEAEEYERNGIFMTYKKAFLKEFERGKQEGRLEGEVKGRQDVLKEIEKLFRESAIFNPKDGYSLLKEDFEALKKKAVK